MEKISYSDIVRHNHACVVSSIAHLNNLVGGMSADSRAQYAIVNRVVAAGQGQKGVPTCWSAFTICLLPWIQRNVLGPIILSNSVDAT
jgi:hypothetical protein